jgi:hypothetical protein
MAVLLATGPRSGTHLKTGTDGLCSVPMERRCTTDAIRLHDPDFKRTPKKILFPGNKKMRFLIFYPRMDSRTSASQ